MTTRWNTSLTLYIYIQYTYHLLHIIYIFYLDMKPATTETTMLSKGSTQIGWPTSSFVAIGPTNILKTSWNIQCRSLGDGSFHDTAKINDSLCGYRLICRCPLSVHILIHICYVSFNISLTHDHICTFTIPTLSVSHSRCHLLMIITNTMITMTIMTTMMATIIIIIIIISSSINTINTSVNNIHISIPMSP